MACTGCSVSKNGKSGGCGGGCSSNGCASGGCNRLNTYDWLAEMDLQDTDPFDIVEVSFKNGARKSFFRNHEYAQAATGEMVVVETGTGYDVGRVSLSGELVRLQMKKKRVNPDTVLHTVLRVANERDLEKLQEARNLEAETMVRARAIAQTLGLDMKIGDVEFQGDQRKATFYYTADGRVDFRELIRHYAKEFRVKIEMRQIGARQESARIGGIGSCGRELCCSTWLTDFKSVSTAAARYQNLAINQAKLSGQCGRLKCCLNYELDIYLDALEHFPEKAEKLYTKAGAATLFKTDIFKGLMFYVFEHEQGRGKIYTLSLAQVKAIKEKNDAGEKPDDLGEGVLVQLPTANPDDEDATMDFEDVTGAIELPDEKRRKKRKKKRNNNNDGATGKGREQPQTNQQPQKGQLPKAAAPKSESAPPPRPDKPDGQSDNRNRRSKNRRNRDNRKKT
ncbi:MAG TPA: regulatory iron-sulfur-containing complex subunit RicT [Saprospiraceae bacterium]|nr:regulatory iron-sulfur-containing complex subunit RicT [Saprospiraceae bacterium]HMP13529.1 regulatory iron-sulfur-containing complex subunit RicT [Saprospiraceae bacterium]